MLRVALHTYNGAVIHDFPDYCEPRVLASGALKIVRFAADPEVAEDGEDFTEAPLVTVAVFNGDYTVRRVQNEE